MNAMADQGWIQRFRYRLEDFEATTRREGVACSLKWRATTGRFDRASSPAAYRIIEAGVRRNGAAGRWVEMHSNGPELLLYLAVTPEGFAVGADVVELLVELARARAAGIRAGDVARDPLELIVRRFDEKRRYVEESLLTLPSGALIDAATVAKALRKHAITVGPATLAASSGA